MSGFAKAAGFLGVFLALFDYGHIDLPDQPERFCKLVMKEARKTDWSLPSPSRQAESVGTRWGRRLRAGLMRQTLRRGDGTQTRYALIVNGDDGLRHLKNVERFTEHLRRGEQLPPENILVLCSESCERRFHEASREGLRSALVWLRQRLDADDLLFVYTTGHGDDSGGVVSLMLQDDERVAAQDFADAVLELPVEAIVYFGDQCFSGGFALAMSGQSGREVLAMSATDEKHADDCTLFTPAFLDYLAANPQIGRYYQHAFTCARLHARREYEENDWGERPEGLYLESPAFPLGDPERFLPD